MSNTPIAQIAVSTIKGIEKQNIYPKTIDRAVLTTDKEGNEDTLDNVLIKGIDINGEIVTPDENGVVSVSIPFGGIVIDPDYVHTDNNFTDEYKEKIDNYPSVVVCTQAEYNALVSGGTVDADTTYYITES